MNCTPYIVLITTDLFRKAVFDDCLCPHYILVIPQSAGGCLLLLLLYKNSPKVNDLDLT